MAGLLTVGAARTAGGEELAPINRPEQAEARDRQRTDEHKDEDRHAHDHGAEFPRTHPGPGGPLGSATDRGKLVPGFRAAGEPPVPVETPDVAKLAWDMKNGVKEFHLIAQHVRREFLPGKFLSKEEGGRHTPFFTGYRPAVLLPNDGRDR